MFFVSVFFLTIFLFTPVAQSQFNSPQSNRDSSEIGVNLNDQQFSQVETQLEQGIPNILEQIKNIGDQVKAGNWDQAKVLLEQAKKDGQQVKRVLEQGPQYDEIESYVDKIREAMALTDQAIISRQKRPALQNLAQAYKWAKAISESPVLKLTATEVALGQASQQILQRDYNAAGLFLQKAVDSISEVQQDPKVNSAELNKLKNDIILTQQQVVLGKLQDEKRLNRFVPGLAAARVNALNTYYTVWDRSNMPWDQY